MYSPMSSHHTTKKKQLIEAATQNIAMNSVPNSYMFPYIPSPPPPSHPISPPPPPHVFPPPPPHVFPPPPPHVFPPPPPHVTPAPPHVPPPLPPPPHHHTIIIVAIVSCGGFLFLASLCAALFCFLKKRKKTVEKTHDEIVKVDEHLKIKEAIEEGPHGKKIVLLSVEDDVHTERIDVDEMKMKADSLGQEKMYDAQAEISPSDLEEGRSSSSPKNHHMKQDS